MRIVDFTTKCLILNLDKLVILIFMFFSCFVEGVVVAITTEVIVIATDAFETRAYYIRNWAEITSHTFMGIRVGRLWLLLWDLLLLLLDFIGFWLEINLFDFIQLLRLFKFFCLYRGSLLFLGLLDHFKRSLLFFGLLDYYFRMLDLYKRNLLFFRNIKHDKRNWLFFNVLKDRLNYRFFLFFGKFSLLRLMNWWLLELIQYILCLSETWIVDMAFFGLNHTWFHDLSGIFTLMPDKKNHLPRRICDHFKVIIVLYLNKILSIVIKNDTVWGCFRERPMCCSLKFFKICYLFMIQLFGFGSVLSLKFHAKKVWNIKY